LFLVHSHYTKACAQSTEQNDPLIESQVATGPEDALKENKPAAAGIGRFFSLQ